MTTAPRPRILVVDDQALLRVHANLALEEAGFAVLEASDAQEALDLLEREPKVVAVFTDVRMPGDVDGLALAHRLRADRPELKIVVTSGACRIPDADLPPGGVFVAKPYTAAQITRVLGER
ncbi:MULTISPECIES: response regulator [unclassified Sphingomonas]|jgi:CheY-like chemotaxis protein|uniref:response regulator n=1 Tax=unclassified Sphingomonas TaxID=196159 RepID=UPI000E10DB41|nr:MULTISPECIES: response regulator [unclassified Sphingomonas]AXJ94585.1 response regulator [Sphingomonas sp. FARSPH]